MTMGTEACEKCAVLLWQKKSLNVHTVEGGSQNEAACSAAQGKSISVQTDPTLWFVKYLIGTVLSAVTLDLVQMLYL